MKRALLAVFLLLPLAGVAQEERAEMIRIFSLRHIAAIEIVPLIRPLLSPHGSVTLHSKTNSIAVKDWAQNLDAIGRFLNAVDAPPNSFRISVKLIQASLTPSPKRSISREIQGISSELVKFFPYKTYDVLAKNIIEGLSGDQVSFRLNESYHVDFLLHNPLRRPDIVQLKGFRLSRVSRDGRNEVLRSVLRTTINLRVDQNHVVGVSNSLANNRALIFVFRVTQK